MPGEEGIASDRVSRCWSPRAWRGRSAHFSGC